MTESTNPLFLPDKEAKNNSTFAVLKKFRMYTKTFKQLVFFIFAILIFQNLSAQTARIRVGTFDSRLVALAYYNSKDYDKFISDFNRQYKVAESKKDSVTIKKMLVRGPVLQRMMNDRIFGKGSINLILDNYKDKLDAIGKANNVIMVVSKWEVGYKTPGLEFVDLTWKIMAIWNPSEQVIKWAKNGEKELPIKDAIFDKVD